MTTLEILKQARTLIELGWAQGGYARSKNNRRCKWYSPRAVRFCPLGAIYRARGYKDEPIYPYQDEAVSILQGQVKGIDLVEWNDAPQRTQHDVLALLDSAIEKAKEVNHDNA